MYIKIFKKVRGRGMRDEGWVAPATAHATFMCSFVHPALTSLLIHPPTLPSQLLMPVCTVWC